MNSIALQPDICVIGAGSGGLSVAAGAAAFGMDVVLIEKGLMGGDCLNYGCVPSKALLASAKATRARHGGLDAPLPGAFECAQDHVAATIAAIAPHDSRERFEGLGVTVLRGAARFVARDTVAVGDRQIRARRFVIATGSSPVVPPIPGLDRVPYLTNESLFANLGPKDHLLIVGGGPIGLEMAQAHRRLGAAVTVVEAAEILSRDDRDHAGLLRQALLAEGITLLEGARLRSVRPDGQGLAADALVDGKSRSLSATHLLLAVGRKPNVEELGLENAGIVRSKAGIAVNGSLRTANRRVYAIGDVVGGQQFTHAAGAQAGLVLRAMLFRLPIRFKPETIPWVTYTTPEIAHVGLTLEQARDRHGGQVKVLSASFESNDRARAENAILGGLKLYAGRKGRLLGADILGAQAGELAAFLSYALSRKATMRDLAGYVAPYPTLSEIIRRAALSYYADAPANPWVRRLLEVLRWFG